MSVGLYFLVSYMIVATLSFCNHFVNFRVFRSFFVANSFIFLVKIVVTFPIGEEFNIWILGFEISIINVALVFLADVSRTPRG